MSGSKAYFDVAAWLKKTGSSRHVPNVRRQTAKLAAVGSAKIPLIPPDYQRGVGFVIDPYYVV